MQIIGVIDGGNDSMGSLSLYMPRATIAELYGDDNPSFPSVMALAAEGTDMDELCKTIESKVRSMKGISEDDEYDSVSASSMKSAIDASTPLWAPSRSSWARLPAYRCLWAESAL